MLRSAETMREMLRQYAESAPSSICSAYMLEVANDATATLFALELALHAWDEIMCSCFSPNFDPREVARGQLAYMANPERLGCTSGRISPSLFFAALHAAGIAGDLNLGCSLAQSNGVVVLSLSPMPVLAAMPLEKWKAALTDAAKAAL